MVCYTCDKCNKEFTKKSNYITHQNKKKSCIKENIVDISNTLVKNITMDDNNNNKIINNNEIENTIFNCLFCNQIFSRNDNLQRHIKNRCKIKKYIDELEITKTKLKEATPENEKLNKIIKENNIATEKNKSKFTKTIKITIE
jgi:hypothetical protein